MLRAALFLAAEQQQQVQPELEAAKVREVV